MDTPPPESCALEVYLSRALKPQGSLSKEVFNVMSNSDLTLHDALNTLLADSFALYIKTKSFHWHVTGPHFREYHLMFDAHAASILETTDVIAERVLKTGGSTLRSIGNIARLQRVEDNDRGGLTDVEMIRELLDDNRALLVSLREAKALTEKTGDIGTGAVLDPWIDGAEERVWFLAATLRN